MTLAEKFVDVASQQDSDGEISEYFRANFKNLTKRDSLNSLSDFKEMEIIKRLRHATSIKVLNQNKSDKDQDLDAIMEKMKDDKAGKLTRENTIMSQRDLMLKQQSEESIDLSKEEKTPLPPMKKNHSHITNFQLHKLQTGVAKEKEEFGSESDYRSAYSHAL